MPTISEFYGILIQMYYNEHEPPHFHARYGEFELIVEIDSLRMTTRSFPKHATRLVLEWADMHKRELLENWSRVGSQQELLAIPPLD